MGSRCLTGKEYKMLELLTLRKGVTITKEMFLNYLYDGMDEPEAKIVDVFLCKLRKKLASASGGNEFIETIWARGYVLREPKNESRPEPPESTKKQSRARTCRRQCNAMQRDADLSTCEAKALVPPGNKKWRGCLSAASPIVRQAVVSDA
jgi:DNA-binding winged helix-turn-helix (wHTH) protein